MVPNPKNNNSPASSSAVVLAVLLVLSLALTILYGREGEDGVLHGIQSSAQSLMQPAAHLGAAIGTKTESLGDSVEEMKADPETIKELKEQNAELREQLAQAEEYSQEAKRLEDLLDLVNAYHADGVAASVVGRSVDAWDQTVTINVGASSGVSAGMTVMGPSGVIGQISSVKENASIVRLITDPQSGVAVLLQSNRKEGVVTGSLEGLLYLENVDSEVVVQVGDVVVTSGMGGSYARGLMVGIVVQVEQDGGVETRKIVVAPNEDAGPLQEVFVVGATGAPKESAQAETASADEAQGEGGN